ncbi:MAG: hypothetical protein FJ020_09305 [Chloroflexi bacterium]|nr:hypothetical protein [Chloroflexota bacterium]
MAKTMGMVGKAAFVVGVLFALIGGIWGGKSVPTNDAVIWVLLIAGILIGLLNVTAKEAAIVLSAAVALVILGIWGFTPAFYPVGDISEVLAENLVGIVCAFALLMAPAAIIIAIKAVIATAKPGD